MQNEKLVDIKKAIKNPILKCLYAIVQKPVEYILKINNLNKIYKLTKLGQLNFFDNALDVMGVDYELSEEDIQKIPLSGPLVVVSNHPFGGLDGIAMASLLISVRPDFKYIANMLLSEGMPEIREWMYPVDPFGNGSSSIRRNLESMKNSISWLKKGGCLATFPSGTVSHLSLKKRQIRDPKWNANIARLARKTGATVLPIFFEGTNPIFFQLAGLIHPKLRTLLLPKQLPTIGKKKTTLKIRVGKPILPRSFNDFENDEKLIEYFRLSSYMLGKRAINESNKKQKFIRLPKISKFKKQRKFEEIVPAVPIENLREDIIGLPEKACLVPGKNYSVYYARKKQIPNILREIGRLREVTFREVFEGTGKSIDLDEFDDYYIHLFMWDHKNGAIVGAYRFGLTDDIIKEYGKNGLYTTTLFNFKEEFLDKLNPAMEMGRSFITKAYQKKQATLMLLWRGIGTFICQNPKYKILFGPVSINAKYTKISHDLIVQFLKNKNKNDDLSNLVKAKNPPKAKSIKGSDKEALITSIDDIEQISALISEIEIDDKGVPVLLKHYLKLNGKILAFNIDNDFGSCLDGLIFVDLTSTDPKMLGPYLGKEGVKDFRAFHGLETN